MEYLVYLGFFAAGWMLAKADSRKQWATAVRQVAEAAFKAGAQFGYAETIKAVSDNHSPQDSIPMGFSVPNSLNKDHRNDN